MGSIAGEQFAKLIQSRIDLKLINCGDGVLNSNCGADCVKVGQHGPLGLELIPNRIVFVNNFHGCINAS